jgi:hypothetical protein
MKTLKRTRSAIRYWLHGEIPEDRAIFWLELGWHQAEKKIYGPHGDAYTATIGRPSALTGGAR